MTHDAPPRTPAPRSKFRPLGWLLLLLACIAGLLLWPKWCGQPEQPVLKKPSPTDAMPQPGGPSSPHPAPAAPAPAPVPSSTSTEHHAQVSITLLGDANTYVLRRGFGRTSLDANHLMLVAGDTVTTEDGQARIQLGAWGELVLDTRAAVSIVDTMQDTGSASAHMQLQSGGLQFYLVAGKEEARAVKLGDEAQTFDIAPGWSQATGRVARVRGEHQVILRLGRLQTSAGVVEAGHIVTFGNDGNMRVAPLADETVSVGPEVATLVHHQGPLPPLTLHWDANASEAPRLLEIARDPNFSEIRIAELLQQNTIVLDTLKTGRTYFWRVDKGPAKHLPLVPQAFAGCPACAGPNPVTDALARTVIQFETSMPELDFSWKPTQGASHYLFRLWRNNHFDTPLIEARVTRPNIVIAPEHLLPGGYIWRVTDFDAKARVVHPGVTYALDVQEMRTHLLRVITPRPRAVLSDANLFTRGAVHGARALLLDGKRVPLDDDGNFAYVRGLHPGRNLLVFSLAESGGVQHRFARTVSYLPAAAVKTRED